MIQAPALAPGSPAPPVLGRLDQLRRAFQAALPRASATTEGVPLELSSPADLPLLADAKVMEDAVLQVHTPAPAAERPFTAFLDGTQRSDLVGHTEAGVPVVVGVVAAVVRRWHARQAATWRLVRRQRLYAPRAAVEWAEWITLCALDPALCDTSEQDPALADAHPDAQRNAALQQIHRDRQQAESELARVWCAEYDEALYVDGGLRGSEVLARASQPVGVVKSHRTLYGDRAARRVVFDLRPGQRSSVFLLASPSQGPVASWYLRLRDPAGHDPLWGLVRVEVCHEPDAHPSTLGARADALSRRILAERMPTAHPDARWDTMVYGILDCEVFLKATQ